LSGPLQEGHAKYDEDDIHYKGSTRTDHPQPCSRNTPTHYVPTQYPVPTEFNASPPLPLESHPSSLGSGNPSRLPPKKPSWSKLPSSPESPGIVEGNVDKVDDSPCTKANSCDDESIGSVDDTCRKEGE